MRAGLLLLALLTCPNPVRAAEDGELVRAPGWELAAAHCGACHSYRLVTAQRGDERFWADVIEWMERTQNFWGLPDEQEEVLVRYLATAYGEEEWGRRPALSPQLMPGADGVDQERR